MSDNNYISRIGFNMTPLPFGNYTFCIEFFMPDITKFQSLNCTLNVLNIGNQTTKKFSKYTRSIINFTKGIQTVGIFIFIDLHLSGDSSSPSQLPCNMIVYGIKETQSDVDPKVFDAPYIFENSKIVMQTDIDMNNHDISVKNPTKDDQPVSLAFLKTLKYYFTIPFYFNKTKNNSLCYYSNGNTFFYNSKKSVLEEIYLFTNYSANGRDYLIKLKLKYFSRGNEIKKRFNINQYYK